MTILPRQARDKHRENSKKARFLTGGTVREPPRFQLVAAAQVQLRLLLLGAFSFSCSCAAAPPWTTTRWRQGHWQPTTVAIVFSAATAAATHSRRGDRSRACASRTPVLSVVVTFSSRSRRLRHLCLDRSDRGAVRQQVLSFWVAFPRVCLSQACLGKLIVFSGGKTVFHTCSAAPR